MYVMLRWKIFLVVEHVLDASLEDFLWRAVEHVFDTPLEDVFLPLNMYLVLRGRICEQVGSEPVKKSSPGFSFVCTHVKAVFFFAVVTKRKSLKPL